MLTFTFAYNTDYLRALRDTINEERNLSCEKTGTMQKQIYPAWNRICAIMDRLDDTVNYINGMVLGECHNRSAFDFYEFINCSYIVIDCIKSIAEIYSLDLSELEDSKSVFGDPFLSGGTDGLFFNYIRSLCAVHPICTSYKRDSVKVLSQNRFCPLGSRSLPGRWPLPVNGHL